LLSKNSSVFSLISIFSLGSEILNSTWSSLMEWASTVFFCFCLILFFCGFPYFCHLLFCISYFPLQFIYVTFYSVLCFTLLFV
jgi:hypothetical protein